MIGLHEIFLHIVYQPCNQIIKLIGKRCYKYPKPKLHPLSVFYQCRLILSLSQFQLSGSFLSIRPLYIQLWVIKDPFERAIYAGIILKFTSGRPSRAFFEHTRISQLRANSSPPPRAAPSIAAITGTCKCCMDLSV